MITLALLRHAKAVKDDPGGDHARRLSDVGRTDAVAAGDWLRRALAGPVLVLASDARRTRETAELAFPAPRQGTEIRLEADLYGASMQELLERIQALGSKPTVVVVGHNPGIGETAWRLVGADPDGFSAQLREGFPTAACAVLQFDGTWAEVEPGRGRLTALHLRDRDG